MSKAEAMLGLAEPLSVVVSKKFKLAFEAKNLVFSDTELTILHSKQGVPVSGLDVNISCQHSQRKFQLRYCPALAQKPKGHETKTEQDGHTTKPDPFANPPAELLVGAIPKDHLSHILVLNKYPVIYNHFILATKLNKPQTDILEEDDLSITYACLQAWSRGRDSGTQLKTPRLFCFFNSGEHSGASQVHRHLQFVPVEDMTPGEGTEEWHLLLDRMTTRAHPRLPLFHDPKFPLLHFSTPLEGSLSASSLYSKYMLLMKAAQAAASNPGGPLSDEESIAIEENGRSLFSYNLAMTTETMAICPRSQESTSIPTAGAESSVAINGTVLGGTLMVKDEGEWKALQEDPSLLDGMLEAVGFPRGPGSERVATRL